VNPYTGLSYAEDPTIVAYETGNELDGIVWGDKNVPNDWIREICQFVKQLGKSPPSPPTLPNFFAHDD
jgi:mannan endo-1,4-beta-mannosidase